MSATGVDAIFLGFNSPIKINDFFPLISALVSEMNQVHEIKALDSIKPVYYILITTSFKKASKGKKLF